MKQYNFFKVQIKIALLLSMILLMSIYINYPMNNSDPFTNSENLSNDDINDKDFIIEKIDNPKSSITGTHPWWDPYWSARQLINTTNANSVNLFDYTASITFNYTNLVNQGLMNSSLKDVRIVEYKDDTPYVRKYYFQMNYPQQDIATVWFDINVSASTTETDTYLYYGYNAAQIDGTYFMNTSSDSPSECFGWIRNGDFELHNRTGTVIDGVFGWNWSNDVPDDIYQDYIPVIKQPPYQMNLSYYIENQERKYDNFAFKFGDIDSWIKDKDEPTNGHDYIGTLFSYPFVVPTVTGGLDPKIEISYFRNIRIWDEDRRNKVAYFTGISTGNYDQSNINDHTVVELPEHWESIGTGKETIKNPTVMESKIDSTTEDTRGSPVQTGAGGLTDDITIDVTDYQGQVIFLEFGFYAKKEEGRICAFGQIDNVKFSYTVSTSLNQKEFQKADITIITRDVDGRLVPGAKVSLVNASLPEPLKTQTTSYDDASTIFTGIDYETYNFTVNFTLPSGKEETVYDSTQPGERDFSITQSRHNYTLILDMWTIDFEIVDSAGEPLTVGYINVSDSKGSGVLQKLILDSEGKATFRWKNQSSYYYEVYYDNDDYGALSPTPLNKSIIIRADYDKDLEKYQHPTININVTNTATGNTFSVSQRFYGDGSKTDLGNKKIIKFNVTITVQEAPNKLDDVSIYYIDKDNSTDGNRIFFDDSYTVADDVVIIPIDIREPPETNANLKIDYYEAYGILVVVNGQNTTRCDGIIKVDTIETCNIYNITALAKLNIRVIDPVGDKVIGCTVKVNNTNLGLAIDLITKEGADGYAFGQVNDDYPFWYKIGYKYNFSLVFFGTHKNLIVNKTEPSQWTPGVGVDVYYYNYTLNQKSNITFEVYFPVGINASWFQTKFIDLQMTESVIWGENITVLANFTLTTNYGATWEPVTPPATVIATIRSVGFGSKTWLVLSMSAIGSNGIYQVEFNSSRLSAGGHGEDYLIVISGGKTGYSIPNEVSNSTFVDAVSTAITLHDYDNLLIEMSDLVVSQHFGEPINITVKFYNDTDSPLQGATLIYEWLGLDTVYFYADPLNDGYYTATIDTSVAETVGLRSFKITARLENYTTQILFISLNVLERPTSLNGKTDLVYISKKVWVEDEEYFNFTYRDITYGADIIVGDLDIATYIWKELDENGNPIIGNDGTEILTQNVDNTYTLDFNTGTRSVGYYFLSVSMKKGNYELRGSYINLEIQLREFDADLDATNLDDDQVTVVKGKDVKLEIELVDTTRGDIPLRGAKVILEIGDKEYEFDEDDPGIYTYTFSTEEIDAFYTSQTFTGQIIIKKVNFTSEEIDITIVVEMEEIFDGMPTFYLILLVAIIGGIIGSLVSYRVIQQARIPRFVKKIRKVKKTIKAKKPITESYSIPTMEQMILKQFGTDWKAIGFSLEDNLGIKDLKSKSSTEENKITKVRGENN